MDLMTNARDLRGQMVRNSTSVTHDRKGMKSTEGALDQQTSNLAPGTALDRVRTRA